MTRAIAVDKLDGYCFRDHFFEEEGDEEDYICYWCEKTFFCGACQSTGSKMICKHCNFDLNSYGPDYQKFICNSDSRCGSRPDIFCQNCNITFCGECYLAGRMENMINCPKCGIDVDCLTDIYIRFKCDDCNDLFVVMGQDNVSSCQDKVSSCSLCNITMCQSCTSNCTDDNRIFCRECWNL